MCISKLPAKIVSVSSVVGGKGNHSHKREQVIKGRGSRQDSRHRSEGPPDQPRAPSSSQLTLQGFVVENVEPGAKVYNDHGGYVGLPNHERSAT